MKESSIWKNLNQLAKKNKWHLTRIENSTGVQGIPDVYCMVEGHSFWLELKSKEGKNLGLSNYQINWHIKHILSGGKVFILRPSTLQGGFEILKIRVPRTMVNGCSRFVPPLRGESLPDSGSLPDSESLPNSESLPYIHISQNQDLEKLIRTILNKI
jgi:hypothetical protein